MIEDNYYYKNRDTLQIAVCIESEAEYHCNIENVHPCILNKCMTSTIIRSTVQGRLIHTESQKNI